MKNIIKNLLGIQSSIAFFLRLFAGGEYVGHDQFDNKYYRKKARKGYNHERRFIVYKSGNMQASEVPAEFHGWLHHQNDQFPNLNRQSFRKPWQKPHTPNLTGTTLAYRPDKRRAKVTGDYEPWTPA